MKNSIAVGAGITGFPMVFIPKIDAAWAPKTIVHPSIDNLRVVTITDEKMISGNREKKVKKAMPAPVSKERSLKKSRTAVAVTPPTQRAKRFNAVNIILPYDIINHFP